MLAHRLNRISETNRADPRLHAERADPRARRVRLALPGLPDLRLAAGRGGRAGPLARRADHRARATPEPGRRPVHLRLPPRRAPAAPPRGALRRGEGRVARVHAQAPAGDRAGHREGGGGHRLLHLRPPGLAERGRREPEPVRHAAGGGPRAARRARRAVAHLALGDLHARHEAERGRARPDRRAHRAARRVAERARPLDADERGAARGRRRAARPRPARRAVPVPDARRRLPGRGARPRRVHPRHVRRADPGLHGEGAPRGQGPHELDQPRRGLRGGRPPLRRGRSSPRPASSRTSPRSRGASRAPAACPRSRRSR